MVTISEFSKEAIRWSKSFERTLKKRGALIDIIPIQENKSDDIYSELYGQPDLEELEPISVYAVFETNPPEQFFIDMHLETRGDGIVTLMTYSLVEAGLIGSDISNFQNVADVLIGCHVRLGSNTYRVDEVKPNAEYKGFPMQVILSLNYLDVNE